MRPASCGSHYALAMPVRLVKKPIEFEAVRFAADASNHDEVVAFLGDAYVETSLETEDAAGDVIRFDAGNGGFDHIPPGYWVSRKVGLDEQVMVLADEQLHRDYRETDT